MLIFFSSHHYTRHEHVQNAKAAIEAKPRQQQQHQMVSPASYLNNTKEARDAGKIRKFNRDRENKKKIQINNNTTNPG